MKTTIISKILLSLGVAFVLVSAMSQVRAGNEVSSSYPTGSEDANSPL